MFVKRVLRFFVEAGGCVLRGEWWATDPLLWEWVTNILRLRVISIRVNGGGDV